MSDFPYLDETIGSSTYRAVALPMKQWSALGEFLSEFLGEPVTSLVKGFDIGDLRELVAGDSGAVAVLFSTVAQKLTTQRFLAVTHHMGPSLKVMGDDGEWVDLGQQQQDAWWAHHRGELPGAVWLFLRAQYADFFSGFAGLMPIKRVSGSSPSDPTSGQDEGSPST